MTSAELLRGEREPGYDLERIAQLLEAATPGPWVENPRTMASVFSGERLVAGCAGHQSNFDPFAVDAENAANAHLIVAAVNALPSMLADLRLLREARESGALERAARVVGAAYTSSDARALRALHEGT